MKRKDSWFIARRHRGRLIGQLEPLRYSARLRASNEVRIGLRRPESVPALTFGEVTQKRRPRRIFERFGRGRAADEMHGVD